MFATLRHSLRSLVRTPVYSFSAVITLGLGLGANAVVYAFANAVFVRPLPFAREAELAAIQSTRRDPKGNLAGIGGGELDFVNVSARNRSFQSVGALRATSYALLRNDEVETVSGAGVSASMWEVLGTRPIAGRVYSLAEDVPQSSVIVIGEGFQRRNLPGPAGDAVSKTLIIDGTPRVVVGVMPLGFTPALVPGDVWVPLGLNAGTLTDRTGTRLHALVGRLAPGVTAAKATDDLSLIAKQLETELPVSHRGWGSRAVPLREAVGGSTRTLTVLLMSFVLVLLVLACTNVANLSLARMTRRRSELSTRLALGAAPASLVARQVVEGALLGLGGGIFGIAITAGVLHPLLSLVPNAPPLLAFVGLDWRVGAYVAVLSVFAGAAVALGPAYLGVRSAATSALAGGGRRQQASIGERRLRRTLMAGQVAAASLLLVTSVSIIGAMQRLNAVDTGLDARGVVVGRMTLPARYADRPARNQFVTSVIERLEATPGVSAVGVTNNRFLLGQNPVTVIAIQGKPADDGQDLTVELRRATPGYFKALGIRPLTGRVLESTDRDSMPGVAVVNQAFVRRYFANEEVLGKQIRRTGGSAQTWLTVVGVVPDVRDAGVGVQLGPAMYVSYLQNNTGTVTFVAKSSLAAPAAERAMRAAVRGTDPVLALEDVSTLTWLLDNSLGQERLRALILAALAVLALTLACTGIYGVTAFLMAERTREIAIRMALGAAPRVLLTQLIAESGRWIVAGGAAGLVAAWASGVVWRTNVPELGESGAGAYIGTVVILGWVSLFAAWLPARRASRIPPAMVLRADS